MAEAPANCFPLKFHGILWNSDFPLGIWQIPQELMEEGKDLIVGAMCCPVLAWKDEGPQHCQHRQLTSAHLSDCHGCGH